MNVSAALLYHTIRALRLLQFFTNFEFMCYIFSMYDTSNPLPFTFSEGKICHMKV